MIIAKSFFGAIVTEGRYKLVNTNKIKQKQSKTKNINSGWAPYESRYDSLSEVMSHPDSHRVESNVG